MTPDNELEKMLEERFKQLPKPVQNAILSADVQKHMRELAQAQNLHVDQWGTLENEVQMALLGVQPVEDLAANIKSQLRITEEQAESLATEVSKIVFEPIRQELERQLEHPAAAAAKTTGVEDVRTQMLADAAPGTPAALAQTPAPAPVPAVTPATPPPTAPSSQVERTPVSVAYTPATPSHERKTIDGDPYREQLD